jgi:predicted TPR repeat methyltransferase
LLELDGGESIGWSILAEIEEASGAHDEASDAYRRALELAMDPAQRAELERRLSAVVTPETPITGDGDDSSD